MWQQMCPMDIAIKSTALDASSMISDNLQLNGPRNRDSVEYDTSKYYTHTKA